MPQAGDISPLGQSPEQSFHCYPEVTPVLRPSEQPVVGAEQAASATADAEYVKILTA